MRKFLPFLFAAALASSCIDNAYDLSNVTTDDVTIGDEDSEYRLPLATVYVSMSELKEGGADIKTLFDEADIWLPSPLPGNAAYVDLRELQNTPETITPLLDALIDQMMDDDAKITAVADLLAEKYLSTFLPLLPPNTDPADFKPVFIEAFRNMPMLHDRLSGEVKSLAGSYLTELKVQDVTYDIGKIDIGGDVVDMLCENLDSEGTPNPKNTLHLYGSITSALPVSLRLVPYFSPTNVRFDVTVEPGKTNEIRETQLFESDLRQIIEGAEIILPVSLEKYYPGYDFSSGQQIVITLPYSLFDFLKRGNSGDISDIGITADSYLEAGFNYSFPLLDDKLYIGVRAKFLMGVARARMYFSQFNVSHNEERWLINAAGGLDITAAGLDVTTELNEHGEEVYKMDDINLKPTSPAGYGFAVDLGATYDILPNLQASLAVNDLGFISWSKNKNVTGYSAKELSFTGVTVTEDGTESPDFDIDVLEFHKGAAKSVSRMLRASINAGLE